MRTALAPCASTLADSGVGGLVRPGPNTAASAGQDQCRVHV